jgi:hypothetical protein
MASPWYDRRDNYGEKYGGSATFSLPTYVSGGVSDQTRRSYGYSEQNMLSDNLSTNLENYRVYDKLSGNLSEVTTDFTKLPAFAAECKSSMEYLHGLNEKNLQKNICLEEDLETETIELEQSGLMAGYPTEALSDDGGFPFDIDTSGEAQIA